VKSVIADVLCSFEAFLRAGGRCRTTGWTSKSCRWSSSPSTSHSDNDSASPLGSGYTLFFANCGQHPRALSPPRFAGGAGPDLARRGCCGPNGARDDRGAGAAAGAAGPAQGGARCALPVAGRAFCPGRRGAPRRVLDTEHAPLPLRTCDRCSRPQPLPTMDGPLQVKVLTCPAPNTHRLDVPATPAWHFPADESTSNVYARTRAGPGSRAGRHLVITVELESRRCRRYRSCSSNKSSSG
jgi:hypothetical protein